MNNNKFNLNKKGLHIVSRTQQKSYNQTETKKKLICGAFVISTLAATIVSCNKTAPFADKDVVEDLMVPSSSSSVTNEDTYVGENNDLDGFILEEESDKIIDEVGQFTEGELEANLFLLNMDIDNIYETMHHSNLDAFYEDGKDTYKNQLENMVLVLNGFQPVVEKNKIYDVHGDLDVVLANISSMRFANAYNGDYTMANLDMRNLVHNLGAGYPLIDALETRIEYYTSGKSTDELSKSENAKLLVQDIEALVEGFKGVYKSNYEIIDGDCLPVENENYKEENIVTLNSHLATCGEVLKVNLSDLTDGEVLVLSNLMTSAYLGLKVELNQDFSTLVKYTNSFHYIKSTALKGIENNIDNYKTIDDIKIYPEAADLNEVLLNNYRNLVSGNANVDDKAGYIGDMYQTMKKIYQSNEELRILTEDGCIITENESYCEPTNIISFVKATGSSVVLEKYDVEYVGINEKVEITLLIDRIVNSGLIEEDINYKITYNDGTVKYIGLDDVRDYIDVTYSSLRYENSKREEQNVLKKTK